MQCEFFRENGISLLTSDVDAAVIFREESSYELWMNVSPEGYKAIVDDLKKAYDVVVL